MQSSNDSAGAVDEAQVAAAAHIVAAGGIVVYPTETLYALGVDATNTAALQRLVELKGREPGKPIAVLIDALEMLPQLAEEIPPTAKILMRRFWPGPLTIVLHARRATSTLLTGDSGGIGVRLSSHAVATALVRAVGRPVTAPSANPAGHPPPRRVEAARRYFGERVDTYVDAGCVPGEPASTVVDVREHLRVIRPGAIAAEQLRASVADRW